MFNAEAGRLVPKLEQQIGPDLAGNKARLRQPV
jgi:hypothetical protein